MAKHGMVFSHKDQDRITTFFVGGDVGLHASSNDGSATVTIYPSDDECRKIIVALQNHLGAASGATSAVPATK